MTKREAAIIGAYTGVLVGTYSDLKSYAEELLGGPLFDASMSSPLIVSRIKELSKPDFMALVVE